MGRGPGHRAERHPDVAGPQTLEETTELLDAINKNNLEEAKDAVGDIVVTLIMVCAVLDINLVDCLYGAYGQIKDRKGHLTKEGVFVKEV